jgi:hypothetical protein
MAVDDDGVLIGDEPMHSLSKQPNTFIFFKWAVSIKCPNAPIIATTNAVIDI